MNVPLSNDERIRVLNGDDLYGIMQKILLRADAIDQNRENFWIVGLANNSRILFIELISLGSINSTIAEPMDVFSFALQKRAVKIVLVHNHPSGDLLPSDTDKDTTDNLIQVGRIVNCHVYDHLIITKTSFYSFAETGLLKKLGESLKHVPPYKIEEEIEERVKQASERVRVLAQSELVLKMLTKGMSLEDIAELSGLSIDEIEHLRREG